MKGLCLPSLILLTLVGDLAAEQPFTVSGLNKGQTLEINFSSRGCFHSTNIIISVKDGIATCYDVKAEWDDEKNLALRQVCTRFRVVTHPASALSCGCENFQHQGIVPVRRMRRG